MQNNNIEETMLVHGKEISIPALKRKCMQGVAKYKSDMCKNPKLRFLFFELTLKCNEYCKHCGSRCNDVPADSMLSVEEWKKVIDQVVEDFGTKGYMIVITGGEPLLYPGFFEVVNYIHKVGLSWGMTTNGTLITKEVAKKLKEAGLATVSISIDGLEYQHDEFRRVPGAYRKAWQGIDNLIAESFLDDLMVTTVVTHENIGSLEDMFVEFDKHDFDTWRVINMEPIGRALEYPELLLTKEDYHTMFKFIIDKRKAGIPVVYGCSHFLGEAMELETRNWIFHCTAGISTASIMANGDIAACLDIERRPELIQGNIKTDRFKDVWFNKFKPFREPNYRHCDMCDKCTDKEWCQCDSFHTWNFNESKPYLCFKEMGLLE